MRCKICRTKFNPMEFLKKTCSKECEKEWQKINPKKPISKVSKKTLELNAKYLIRRKKWLEGKICPVTNKPATEIHHMNGREYNRLLDESEWLAVTRFGHAWIHANPKEAREKGWLK